MLMIKRMNLPNHYEIRLMSAEEFGPIWEIHAKKMFMESNHFFFSLIQMQKLISCLISNE